MILEDITHMIENLEWIRLVRNKGKINISKNRVQNITNSNFRIEEYYLNLKSKINLINRNFPS